MLPEAAIPYRIDRGRVLPAFLDENDAPWVATLMAEIDGFQGKPLAELREHLRQGFPPRTPGWKARAVRTVLLRLWKAEQGDGLDPRKVRATLFSAAAQSTIRDEAIARAAEKLAIDGKHLLAALFADLPDERRLTAPIPVPTPSEVIVRTNQAMAKGLLFHARYVRIRVDGSPRALVQQAKLRGLLCHVHDGDPPILHLSGPFSLFRHTLLYGRALGDLLRSLGATTRFGLRASCVLRGQTVELSLSHRDPIFPEDSATPSENPLLIRLAKDVRKQTPDWELHTEADAIHIGDAWVYPDFHLRRRDGAAITVEVLGYWSPEFVAKKLALVEKSGRDDLILCVDTALGTGKGALPSSPRLVRFHKRLAPAAIIAAATARTATDPRP